MKKYFISRYDEWADRVQTPVLLEYVHIHGRNFHKEFHNAQERIRVESKAARMRLNKVLQDLTDKGWVIKVLPYEGC